MGWPRDVFDAQFPFTLAAFDTPVEVTADTVLWPAQEVGVRYEQVAFTVRNHDGDDAVVATIHRSESEVAEEAPVKLRVEPGEEATLTFSGDAMRLNFALSAEGDPDVDPQPTCEVSFQVRVMRRRNR